MPRALGDRQAVAHDKPLGTGVLDLHEQLAQPHAAVKRHPAVRLRLIGHGAQRVLQRIGEHGAQLGVGDRQLARELRVHLQPNAHALRLSGEGGAEQVHQLVVAVALGRDALNIRAHLADIFLRLLRLSRRQKAVDGVEMVAHIVLIDGGLHLCPAQRVHLDLRLLQSGLEHGALHLRLRAAAALGVIGCEKHNVKSDERCGQELVDRPVAAIERVGIDDRGVIKEIIRHRQAAE